MPPTLPELQAEHHTPPRGLGGEEHEQPAIRNYIRDLILGFNDGVVSVYALVALLVAGGLGRREVAIAGLGAALAGALSMGIGEYLSTKSQAEYYAAETAREREHIRHYPDLEGQELRDMLTAKGYPEPIVEGLMEYLIADPDRFVDFMMREEFGIGKESARSPGPASLVIMAAFLVGAALPVLPFLALSGVMPATALWWASGLAGAGLFAGGAAKAKVSGLSWLKSGFEMTLLGAVAALITYAVGVLLHGA
ncbi:MAG: VIT1/CCC1 transporter family protein [Thermoplasmatota archaeon]